MKHITKIGILACLFLVKPLNAQDFDWAKSFGGTSSDEGQSISVDALGNVYNTGYFQGTVDFDPGSGTSILTSLGSDDIFVQKIDAFGNLLWVKSFGGTSFDKGLSLNIDALGNVYTTGYFEGTVDFDPGTGTSNHTSTGPRDIFVQKMDSLGNFLWATSFGGPSFDVGQSISIDASGNVYTTGSFVGTADFDPGAGTSNLTSAGSRDIFVQKMDASGNFLWAKSFGGTSNDYGESISLDTSGNLYITGYFRGTVDFDPGVGTSNITTAGGFDIFVQKMDTSGNFLWAKSFGGTFDDFGKSISVDALGNVYTTGYFQGTLDSDPGAGTSNLTSAGSSDIFVQKMDASGNFLWSKSFGSTSIDEGQSISVDTLGNVYTAGSFVGTVDSDPGAGTSNLTSAGSRDIFVQKMDSLGNFLWATSFGGPLSDVGYSIFVDPLGNVYTTGYFQGTVDFNPGSATANLSSNGGVDIFVQKLSQCIPTTGTDQQTACDTYTWIDGNAYTTSNNTATHTLTNQAGCDSVVTLNLTINNSNTGTDTKTACDSYTWIDGNTYTSSNSTATHTLTNQAGCDSVVTLNLTINNSNTGTDTKTACDSYTWIDGNTYTSSNSTATHTLTNTDGCDSVVTLNLTINNSNTGTDVQTACDSYIWIDGNTYTTSNNTATHILTNAVGCDSLVTLDLTVNYSTTGTDVQTACDTYTWIDGNTYTASNNTATHTLSNAAGCDSIVTLNLTINSVSDLTTSITGITISANNSGATYQWLDCDNNYSMISGETNSSYAPSANGNYAVQLTEDGCIDTSACAAITTVGIIENNFGNDLIVYPNPTNGNFSIDLGAIYENTSILITDLSGKLIESKFITQSQTINLTLEAPTGIYIVSIQAGNKNAVARLVKK
jgi:hypothetical protein